jgi:hypothetical protein
MKTDAPWVHSRRLRRLFFVPSSIGRTMDLVRRIDHPRDRVDDTGSAASGRRAANGS